MNLDKSLTAPKLNNELVNLTLRKLGKSTLISMLMDVSGHGERWHPTVNLFIYSVLLNTVGPPRLRV